MKQEVKCTGVILLNSITAGRIMRNEIQMLILFSWSLKISYRKSIFWIYDSENFFVLLSDKSKAVQQIAEFLELKDFNVDSIVSNSSIDATRDRRQKIYESKNAQFKESKCYRKGKSNAWEEELSAEVQKLYLDKYPHLK